MAKIVMKSASFVALLLIIMVANSTPIEMLSGLKHCNKSGECFKICRVPAICVAHQCICLKDSKKFEMDGGVKPKN
ncbi:hypothetical protein P3S67_000077 [Capsicum chacoense]